MGGGNRHIQFDELPPGAFVVNSEVATNGATRIVTNVEWGIFLFPSWVVTRSIHRPFVYTKGRFFIAKKERRKEEWYNYWMI